MPTPPDDAEGATVATGGAGGGNPGRIRSGPAGPCTPGVPGADRDALSGPVGAPAATALGFAKHCQQCVAPGGFAAPQEAQGRLSSVVTQGGIGPCGDEPEPGASPPAPSTHRPWRHPRWGSLLAVTTTDGTTLPTAAELGLMEGSPPPPEARVTLENWIAPPFNRWGLQHLQELVPCAPIPASWTPWDLPRAEQDLGALRIEFGGRARTIGDLLDGSATDGFLVLHRGTIVWEHYANAMGPATRHLCFSVSKSITATVAGILVARGALDPAASVVELVPELTGTSWEGATVQQVLDMRTGTTFDEVYAEVGGDVDIFGQVLGWFPRTDPTAPLDTYTYLAGLTADRAHGGAFDYRTPLTSMLGWLCERAAGDRLHALIARELWEPMGAEFEASLAVDAIGTGFGGGGFNATLRDMARFGELWRRGGTTHDGTQVVPTSWVQDTLKGAADSKQAWLDGPQFAPDPLFPEAFYRNKWWIYDPSRPLYSAIGIHGQYVTIDAAAELVVARFSSLPEADDETDERLHLSLVDAIGEALTG